MSLGSKDVVTPQTPIERDRFRKLGHIGGRTAGEPSTSRNWGAFFHVLRLANVTRETAQGNREVSHFGGREPEPTGFYAVDSGTHPKKLGRLHLLRAACSELRMRARHIVASTPQNGY